MCSTGCGVNVTNSNPTICINDLIQHYNTQHNCSLQQLSCAQLIARTVSWLEAFISSFQQGGPDAILPTYYKRWLHRSAQQGFTFRVRNVLNVRNKVYKKDLLILKVFSNLIINDWHIYTHAILLFLMRDLTDSY